MNNKIIIKICNGPKTISSSRYEYTPSKGFIYSSDGKSFSGSTVTVYKAERLFIEES